MNVIKKEIEELNYFDVTSKYVITNNKYHGIIVMDYSLNAVHYIELGDDMVIDFSVKHKEEMLLFCYESKCAFHVDLENKIVRKFDLGVYATTYFSDIYFWKEGIVYLFADGGRVGVKVNLNNTNMIRISSLDLSDCDLLDQYLELNEKNCLSYDHDRNLALFVQNKHFYIWNQNYKTTIDMGINALEQEEYLPSDLIYSKTDFLNDVVISVSERKIMISMKEDKNLFIYPPYQIYRFFGGKITESVDKKKLFFALSYDNSAEGPTLLTRYEDFD